MENTKTAVPMVEEQDDSESIPSFDELWLEDLKAMGFDFTNEGDLEYRGGYDTSVSVDESEGEEGEPKEEKRPLPIQRMALEKVIKSAVEEVVSKYPPIGRVPYLTEAVQKWLASQPPETITPEAITASVYALYGMYKAKEELFSEFKQDYTRKKNPLRSVPDDMWRLVNRWSELWNIPAEEILNDYLKEVSKQ